MEIGIDSFASSTAAAVEAYYPDFTRIGWLIGRFIYILASELGMDTKTMGSTTLDRAGLNRSGEPDAAYYIQNQALVAGRTVDLEMDPPPDFGRC